MFRTGGVKGGTDRREINERFVGVGLSQYTVRQIYGQMLKLTRRYLIIHPSTKIVEIYGLVREIYGLQACLCLVERAFDKHGSPFFGWVIIMF